jgi:hypothetical protein
MLQEERSSMLQENTPYALTQGLKHTCTLFSKYAPEERNDTP